MRFASGQSVLQECSGRAFVLVLDLEKPFDPPPKAGRGHLLLGKAGRLMVSEEGDAFKKVH